MARSGTAVTYKGSTTMAIGTAYLAINMSISRASCEIPAGSQRDESVDWRPAAPMTSQRVTLSARVSAGPSRRARQRWGDESSPKKPPIYGLLSDSGDQCSTESLDVDTVRATPGGRCTDKQVQATTNQSWKDPILVLISTARTTIYDSLAFPKQEACQIGKAE
jgi:hypothetical protein